MRLVKTSLQVYRERGSSSKLLRGPSVHFLKYVLPFFMQDYDTFFDAKEDNAVFSFLGLPPPPGSKVRTVLSFYL